MNTQDFNLLTKEEIDEVVAEVLAEQGLSELTTGQAARRLGNLAKGKVAAMRNKGKNAYDRASDEEKAAADAEIAALEPGGANQQTAAQQGGAGGTTAPKAETGVQTGTGRSRGFSGNAAMPDDDVVDSATGAGEAKPSTARGIATGSKTKVGMTGGNQDTTRQSASNRTQAQGTGAVGDLRLGAPTSKDPDDAAAAAQGADAPGRTANRDGGMQVNMTSQFHEPGSSNMPAKILSRVQSAYGDEMFSVDMAIDEYLNSMFGKGGDERQRETTRRHWLGYFRGQMAQIDKYDGPDGNPEMLQSAEMEVRRAIDNLLNSAAKRGGGGQGGGGDGGGGGDDGGGDDGGGGDDTPKEPEENPIPINKFPPRGTDPETGEPVDGKRAQPLRSKLSKAGLNPQVINTVMRAITKQLQAQDVPFTESVKKGVAVMVLERLLTREIKNIMLSEVRYGKDDKVSQKIIDQIVKGEGFGPGEHVVDRVEMIKKGYFKINDKKAGIKGLGKKNRFIIAINDEGEARAYSVEKSSKKVQKGRKVGDGDGLDISKGAGQAAAFAGEPEPEKKPEYDKYGEMPALFKKYWNAVTKKGERLPNKDGKPTKASEAWKLLPSGKEGRKRQNVAEARVEPRKSGADKDTVMPTTGQGRGTKRKDLDRSVDKFGQAKPRVSGPEGNLVGAGSDSYEITKASWFDLMKGEKNAEMKSFVGALFNKMKQNIKGRDAASGGFGGDTYKQSRGEGGGATIKMSVMNQQLKANGVDREIRKQVMGLVQKHLGPYLKQHKIKLSEAQLEQTFGAYVDKLLEERARMQNR